MGVDTSTSRSAARFAGIPPSQVASELFIGIISEGDAECDFFGGSDGSKTPGAEAESSSPAGDKRDPAVWAEEPFSNEGVISWPLGASRELELLSGGRGDRLTVRGEYGEAGSGSSAGATGATCDPAVPLKEPFSDEGVISAPLKSDGGAESDNDVNEDLLLCRMLEGAGPVALEVCLVN